VTRRAARLAARSALVLALALLAAIGPRPPAGAAHPLDEYHQATYLLLAPDGVSLEIELTAGVLVAPRVAALLDADADGEISEAEGWAYGRAVLDDVVLDVDERRHALVLSRVELPTMLALTSGLGTIRVEATATAETGGSRTSPASATHQAFVHNGHAPVSSVYQATVVLGPNGGVQVVRQLRDEALQSLRVDYAVAPTARAAAAPAAGAPARIVGGPPEQQRWLVETLHRPAASPWLLLAALALSAVLGGLHALTPGHGKTLLASYLVGSRGTARHALFLGGIVTFAHTASVIAMGLLALLAGHLIVPELLVPTLELSSGLLVLALGARLVRTRSRALRHGHAHGSAHAHAHPHVYGDDHVHKHGHGHASLGRDNRAHPHPDPADAVTWRGLATMGVSGGLVPCPEAIGILLVAVGLNRVAFGMGLIVAFSLGLAAVLCLLGLLIVRSSGLVDHLGAAGRRAQRLLPLGSAVIVTVLGIAISAKAVLAYVG
jgi:nickel/cobalt transporter (NicO) family protein